VCVVVEYKIGIKKNYSKQEKEGIIKNTGRGNTQRGGDMKVQKIKNKYEEEPKMESRREMKGKKRDYKNGEDDVMHT
jgi:hypothetical protein